jgi:hypothetical protein
MGLEAIKHLYKRGWVHLIPCPLVSFDTSDPEFATLAPEALPFDYAAIRNDLGNFVTISGKPVYADLKFTLFVVFNGRRRLFTSPAALGNDPVNANEFAIATIVEGSNFYYYFDQLPSLLLSKPVEHRVTFGLCNSRRLTFISALCPLSWLSTAFDERNYSYSS